MKVERGTLRLGISFQGENLIVRAIKVDKKKQKTRQLRVEAGLRKRIKELEEENIRLKELLGLA